MGVTLSFCSPVGEGEGPGLLSTLPFQWTLGLDCSSLFPVPQPRYIPQDPEQRAPLRHLPASLRGLDFGKVLSGREGDGLVVGLRHTAG